MVAAEFRRSASWVVITLVVVAGVALFGLGLRDQLIRWGDYLADPGGFADRFCPTRFCDVALFRGAGLLARLGAAPAVYDNARFFAVTGQDHAASALPFVYPPVILPLLASLPLVGLAAGYLILTVISLGLGVVLLRAGQMSWPCIAAALLSLPAIWNAYLGQLGLLCAGVLVCGLARLEKSPWWSGVMLACLAAKPQYALLVPVVVIASGQWRAAAAGGLMLILLILLPAALFGWQVWAAYLGPGRASAAALLTANFAPGVKAAGVSIFWTMRSLGAPLAWAGAAQAAGFLFTAVVAWRLWRRPAADLTLRIALTMCLTLLASPYEFIDDLVGYAIALPLLARRETPVTNAILAMLWLAPAGAAAFTARTGILPVPFCVAAALVIGWQRLRGVPDLRGALQVSAPAEPA
jgi:hypothetical protein